MAIIQRDLEITQLYDLVMARESIFLHAPSGMGKTHTIQALFRKLEGRRICFYLSARGMLNNEQLLLGLEQCVKQVAARHSNVEYQLKRFFEEHPMPAGEAVQPINNWFESLLVAIQSISQDFLFVIEDLDQWEGESSPSELFGNFFGSRNSQLLMSANSFNPAFEGDATPFELPQLQLSNFTEINSHESETNAKSLLKFTRGNTAFVLDLLQNKNPADIKLQSHINKVMAIYQPAFYTFRKRFTDLQWRLLKAIANEDKVLQPHSFEFLMNYRLGAASSVERALKNLADTGMILRMEDGWQIENVVLQRWLQWLYANKGQNQNGGSILRSLVA